MKISKGAGMKSKVITALMAVGMMVNIANAAVVSKNGIAKDSATGLMWQDEPYTQVELTAFRSETKNGKVGDWNYAKAYCENLNLGGYSDWRLPNIYELATLMDNTKLEYPYVIDGLKNIVSVYYWSSTTSVSDSSNAWIAAFNLGNNGWYNKTNSSYVRCVRARQLNFDNLVILKNKGKVKVSQKNMISPYVEKVNEKKEAQEDSSSLTGYKIGTQTNFGDRTSYEIVCSNGRSGSVIYYPNNADGSKYYGTSNGNMLDYGNRTFEEAANSICGNR